jgi:hypothetical protein
MIRRWAAGPSTAARETSRPLSYSLNLIAPAMAASFSWSARAFSGPRRRSLLLRRWARLRVRRPRARPVRPRLPRPADLLALQGHESRLRRVARSPPVPARGPPPARAGRRPPFHEQLPPFQDGPRGVAGAEGFFNPDDPSCPYALIFDVGSWLARGGSPLSRTQPNRPHALAATSFRHPPSSTTSCSQDTSRSSRPTPRNVYFADLKPRSWGPKPRQPSLAPAPVSARTPPRRCWPARHRRPHLAGYRL